MNFVVGGESTNEAFFAMVEILEIDLMDFIVVTNASLKNGIKFSDWGSHRNGVHDRNGKMA